MGVQRAASVQSVGPEHAAPVPLNAKPNPGAIINQNAFIPPQCYTDTGGRGRNPCYVCHVEARAPNYVEDAHLQLEYAFESSSLTNPWSNAGRDDTPRLTALTHSEIDQYVRQSNYFDARSEIALARLRYEVPAAWDVDGDGKWSGFIPDARFAFDEKGFDRAPDGSYTGWRVYAYFPLPGAFMPTNGSFGDALVRLPAEFRENEAGVFDAEIYALNLAVLESLITRRDVPIAPTSEAQFSVDLDRDTRLGTARKVAFVRELPSGTTPQSTPAASMQFVGRARQAERTGQLRAVPGLFPVGTEFLHSLRYLDVTEKGVSPAARMKELRYARKTEFLPPAELARRAREEALLDRELAAAAPDPQGAEAHEAHEDELGPRLVSGNAERGVSNDRGFILQGFIEGVDGSLRPESFEESVYCVGCHGGVGATDDGIFSFSRRMGAGTYQDGWFQPGQSYLRGVADPPRGRSTEYVTYLELNRAGDDFAANQEVLGKFFGADGQLKPALRRKLRADINELLVPSPERARYLNKAYFLLVQDQSFSHGRELSGGPGRQVHRTLAPRQKTGVQRPEAPAW